MNMPRSSLARLEVGGYTLVLGIVLALIVSGLLATDRALRTLSAARTEDDALRTALQLERIVSARSSALSAFRHFAVAGPPTAAESSSFRVLAQSYAVSRAGTRRVLLADSTGAFTYEERFGDMTPDSRLVDSAVIHEAARSDQAIATVWKPSVGPAMLVLAQPLGVGRSSSAVAVLDLQGVGASLIAAPADSNNSLVLMTGRDTIPLGRLGRGATRERMVVSPVHLPDGATWTLQVGRPDDVFATRRLLWTFGVLTVLLLGMSVIRERRQALRIRERSAELERLSSELLRANRMKSEFLASVSHELRTPLNAIVGFVELLKDGVYGDLSPRQVGPVDRIAVSAMHLRHLVDQVLDIARIAAGRLEVHTETVSLRTFVLNVASELESLFKERGLQFSIAIPTTLPRVRTDPTHLRQILVNLIGNAVKYTPSGEVAIRARIVGPGGGAGAAPIRRRTPSDAAPSSPPPDRTRHWVALQIVDTGIGIAPADYERIFDEFEQVSAGARGDSIARGTGLGLAISRRLARLLGGDIVVDSQLGKGSVFTVWIAVQPADQVTPATPAPAQPTAV